MVQTLAENLLPESSLLSVPSNGIAVGRLSKFVFNRLEEAWMLSNPFVFVSMLIYAAAVSANLIGNYRQQDSYFFMRSELLQNIGGVTGSSIWGGSGCWDCFRGG